MRSGDNGLSRAEIAVLELIDGRTPLHVWTDVLIGAERANFLSAINELEALGLIRLPPDEVEIELQAAMVEVTELGPQESVPAWAEANRGSHALTEKRFYANPTRVSPANRSPRATSGLHVLVVDDDDAIVQWLTLLLRDKGHRVSTAADAASAAAQLRKPEPPDLVLLDVLLPGFDGFDILATIRKDPRLNQLPVILVTSMVDNAHVLEGLKCGADGYIFKPSKWPTLYECIEAVTGH